MFDSILKALGVGTHTTPRYGADDLEFHAKRYRIHVQGACNALHGVLTDRRYSLLLKKADGVESPSALLGKVRMTWLDIVNGWIDKEFVPKARRFTPPDKTDTISVSSDRTMRTVPDAKNIVCANDHMELADKHAGAMVGVLRYLLCDPSSPVRWSRSLGYEAGPSEVAAWYIRGLQIVEENVGRIREALRTVRDFARNNI